MDQQIIKLTSSLNGLALEKSSMYINIKSYDDTYLKPVDMIKPPSPINTCNVCIRTASTRIPTMSRSLSTVY